LNNLKLFKIFQYIYIMIFNDIDDFDQQVFLKVQIKNSNETEKMLNDLEITDFYIVNNNLFYSI